MNNKLSDNSDYYETLNVSRHASIDEICNAYKKLVLKWHPDKNKNDPNSVTMFKKINEAYRILSNESDRKNYDNYNITTKDVENVIDPYSFFESMMENNADDIPNVIITVEASIDDLYTGFTHTTTFIRYSPCEACNCTGTETGELSNCENCQGRGALLENVKGGKMGYVVNEKKCYICSGDGIDPDVEKCKKCEGLKYVKEEVECDIDVPCGAYDKYCIKLENEGNYIPIESRKNKKQSRSDVIIVIKEISDNKYNIKRGMYIKELKQYNRSDILIEVNIDFADAIYGIKKNLKIFNKKIGIEITDIVQNNDVYVVENYGMPVLLEEQNKNPNDQQKSHGDLFIQFKVNKPQLNMKQKRRLWQIITNTPYQTSEKITSMCESLSFDDYIKKYKLTIENDDDNDDNNNYSDNDIIDSQNTINDDNDVNENDNDNDNDDDNDDDDDKYDNNHHDKHKKINYKPKKVTFAK
jgi:DnaJ-class molecular chaperone